MLNKELCKKCYEETNKIEWSDVVEKRWNERQLIVCPIMERLDARTEAFRMQKTNHEVHKFCRYRLEQLVMEQ